MIIRALFFIIIVFIGATAPTWLFALCAFAYALRYTAYELILISAMIDAYYGLGYAVLPYYTLVTVLALFFLEWIKPRISMYNDAK